MGWDLNHSFLLVIELILFGKRQSSFRSVVPTIFSVLLVLPFPFCSTIGVVALSTMAPSSHRWQAFRLLNKRATEFPLYRIRPAPAVGIILPRSFLCFFTTCCLFLLLFLIFSLTSCCPSLIETVMRGGHSLSVPRLALDLTPASGCCRSHSSTARRSRPQSACRCRRVQPSRWRLRCYRCTQTSCAAFRML